MKRKPTSTQAKGPTQRQLRVGEVMRHALAELLNRIEIDDPDLAGVTVTVTQIRPSPDLRNAAVFVMPLGGLREKEVVAALNRHARFLRGEASRRITLRHMPELKFLLDSSFAEAGKIDALLRSPPVARDLGPEDLGPDED